MCVGELSFDWNCYFVSILFSYNIWHSIRIANVSLRKFTNWKMSNIVCPIKQWRKIENKKLHIWRNGKWKRAVRFYQYPSHWIRHVTYRITVVYCVPPILMAQNIIFWLACFHSECALAYLCSPPVLSVSHFPSFSLFQHTPSIILTLMECESINIV